MRAFGGTVIGVVVALLVIAVALVALGGGAGEVELVLVTVLAAVVGLLIGRKVAARRRS